MAKYPAAVVINGVCLTPSDQYVLSRAFVNKPTGVMVFSPTTYSAKRMSALGLLEISKYGQHALTPLAISIKRKLSAG